MYHRRPLRLASDSLSLPFAHTWLSARAPRRDERIRSPIRDLDQRSSLRTEREPCTMHTVDDDYFSIFIRYLQRVTFHMRETRVRWRTRVPRVARQGAKCKAAACNGTSPFHSRSGADRDATASSVPAPTLSDTRGDLRIEARAHRSSFPPRRATRATRAIRGMRRGMPLGRDRDSFFATRTWRKLKLAWLLHVARWLRHLVGLAQAWLTPKLSERVDSR